MSTAAMHPVLGTPSSLPLPPVNNAFHQISRPPLFEDACFSRMSPNPVPMHFNYKFVNGVEQPTSYPFPAITMTPNPAAAESVPSQASRTQLHLPASQPTLVGTYAGGIYHQPIPALHYTHQNILNPQPEFHSSLVNSGSGHAQYHIPHPQPKFHSSMLSMDSSHTHSLQDPQYLHQSVLNSPPNFHSPMVNAGSSHAQLLQNLYCTHQNILNLQPGSYSSMVNMGSNYAQQLPDPQHTYQNTPNLQSGFNSSMVNMGHANVMSQSHASSAQHYPYIHQEFFCGNIHINGLELRKE